MIVSACSDEVQHEMVGDFFPVFEVTDLKGTPTNILSPNLEKPILVNVWATWCAPCVKELPALERVAQKGDMSVIAISTDVSVSQVTNFITKHDFKHTKFLHDQFGRGSRSFLKAQGLPVTYLINRQGVVENVYLGEKNWDNVIFQ